MGQTFRPWLPIFQALKSVFTDKASRECFPADPLELMGSGRGHRGGMEPAKRRMGTIHAQGGQRGGRKGAEHCCSNGELLQHHPTAPQFSAQPTERNNCVLKRLGLRDTINILTDTSLVNVYKFPWITCLLENYRL